MGFGWIPAKKYKRHYICLKCQKGFKRPSIDDMKHVESTDFSGLMKGYYASNTEQDIVKYINIAFQKIKVVCPNCKNQMVQVHYDFEVPSQRDSKSWKNLQKTMCYKIDVQYDAYIHWHKLELQNEVANSMKGKKLQQNLKKLEKVSLN